MITKDLTEKGIAHPPRWMVPQVQYETYMGSVAYGVSNSGSDIDVYGFCIPPKAIIFPHIHGYINGFGTPAPVFDQYQEHGMVEVGSQKLHDITIYSIVKYLHLCMDNNPNIIDSLFTPERCVIHSTLVGTKVRDNRKIFLHKGCWPKFRGYALSQMHKIRTKNPEGKRVEIVKQFGYDIKFAYHTVRLLNECEQILMEGNLDLERSKEQLKSIRRGEWKIEDVELYFESKCKNLEELYHKSDLPAVPDENKIKSLLIECLEMHYKSIDDCLVQPNKASQALLDIENVINRYKGI